MRSTHSHPRPQTTCKRELSEIRVGQVGQAAFPRPVKALGRKVRNFSEETWVRERERIVLEGSLLKFRQSACLKAELLRTGDKELVGASPLDRIWGVGLGAARAAELCVDEEKGLNFALEGVDGGGEVEVQVEGELEEVVQGTRVQVGSEPVDA